MVDLFYMSRRKADLVSVAGVALCGTCDKLLLGKFVLESLGNRNCGICRAGHAHCLIYIASSGERVADRSAKAGSCAAERLDLRGMIVRLVFKEDKPFLCLGPVSIIHFHGYHNRAGVILVRFFLIVKLAVCLELLHSHDGEIHQADIFVVSVFIKLFSGVEITEISGLDDVPVVAVLKFHILKFRGEGGVAAVIRPVGVQNTDLSDSGISVLSAGKIVLDELKVVGSHRKSQ